MDWLVASVVLSVVLTVGLNLALRVRPGAGDGLARRLTEAAAPGPEDIDRRPRSRVAVAWVPMVVASLVLTVVLNLAIWNL